MWLYLPPLWLFGELYALVAAGELIGALRTVVLFVLTSMIGFSLLRSGGIAVMARLTRWGDDIRQHGRVGELPVAETIPRFVGGFLLLVPGFLSDALGILVLLTPLRWFVVRKVRKMFAAQREQAMRAYCAQHGYADASEAPFTFDGEVVVRPDGSAAVEGTPLLAPPPGVEVVDVEIEVQPDPPDASPG